jgi:hypothetical protein
VLETKTKQSIEEMVSEYLQNDNLDNFITFYKFLKDNKLTVTIPKKILRNSWTIKHKGKKIGAIKIWQKDGWFFSIVMYNQYIDALTFEKYITETQRAFLLGSLRTIPPCPGCKGHDNVDFLGSKYNTVCMCWPHFQWNLSGEALDFAKQLILINKKIVADLTSI